MAVAEENRAARAGEDRCRELNDGRLGRREAGQRRVPERVAHARGQRAGRGREDRSLHGDVRQSQHQRHRRGREREGHASREVSGRRGERFLGPASEERVDPPRHAGRDHEERAARIRSGEARQAEEDEPGERRRASCPFPRSEPFAGSQAPTDHRRLDGSEQDERAGRDAQREIRERERDRVGEERAGGRPRALACRTALAEEEERDYESTGGETDERERRGVDEARPERGPAEERVRGEAHERERRESRGSDALLARRWRFPPVHFSESGP